MPEANVKMSVRSATTGVRIIDIEGEITAFAEPVLAEAFNDASGGDTKTVVLNFEGMDYMNSGGIGLLVTTLIRANRNKQEMRAYGLSDHYREILSLTRLDEAIHIFDGEDGAVSGI